MFLSIGMLKQKYFLADIFILSAEKQPIKLSWRKIECLRFTVGKDGAIYAWCMTVPKAGDKLKIVSLGSDAGIGQKQVTSVELLGEKNKIEWKQEADGLNIVYPDSAHLKTAVGFRIVCK